MAGRVEWNGDALKAKIDAEMRRRLAASAIVVEDHAKVLISVAGTSGGGKRDAQGKFIKGSYTKIRYNANPSRPGEPPHRQTGHLRRSITHEVDATKLVSRAGTNVDYGRWLELGTVHVAARPWLRRALIEKRGEIRLILTKRIPS